MCRPSTVANPMRFAANANVTFDGSNAITFSSPIAIPLSVTSEDLTGTTIAVTNPQTAFLGKENLTGTGPLTVAGTGALAFLAANTFTGIHRPSTAAR